MDKESWKREIYEPEAEIIREIFADAANGVSTKKIASNLAAKGIPSLGESLGRKKASHKWFSAGVARIIRNRSYIGETVINRSDKEVDLGEVTPPIVSADPMGRPRMERAAEESLPAQLGIFDLH
jgi:Recombinase